MKTSNYMAAGIGFILGVALSNYVVKRSNGLKTEIHQITDLVMENGEIYLGENFGDKTEYHQYAEVRKGLSPKVTKEVDGLAKKLIERMEI